MAESDIQTLPIGTIVHSRYQILAVVGRGGLGTVYQVADVLFSKNNIFALKELVDQSAGARKQFELESQWLQSLDDDHIPKVREHFEWQRRLYLVMDFVEGENLEQKLMHAGGRPLPEAQVLQWMLPICDALEYLHSRIPPILHRDVKPSNIIVTPAGLPVLVDLGIAKEHMPGAGMTSTFVRKAGTEGYAPPEQYSAAGQTGPWSDVYGFGATMYHLLTGEIPPTAVERVALDSKLIHPSGSNPSVSRRTGDAIVRALALRPADRFQTISALKRALVEQGYSQAAVPPFAPDVAPRAFPTNASVPAARTVNPPPAGAAWQMNAQQSAPSPLPPLSPSTPASMRETPRDAASSAVASSYSMAGRHTTIGEAQSQSTGSPGNANGSGTRPTRRIVFAAPLLVTLSIVAVTLASFAAFMVLRASAPPDRSSASSTVSGYYGALKHQDYDRAWLFQSASRNGNATQQDFNSTLRADDARLGIVQSTTIVSTEITSVQQVVIQMHVVRSNSPHSELTYTLVVTQYDGNTWLIDSISVA